MSRSTLIRYQTLKIKKQTDKNIVFSCLKGFIYLIVTPIALIILMVTIIGLPLASLAVERLPPRQRWFVYFGIEATIVLPILHYSTWDTALMNALLIAPGIFFVAMVTQVRINEQRAREKAESLARQLETANRRLTEYASQAEELAATQERNRLAREIHDNLGHYLTIVNVQIEAAKLTCESDPARALDALNKAQELARKGLNSVRESVTALRVSPVENRSLEDALLQYAGCAVVISHDRWFLDRIATHILAFEGDSKVVFFDGNYSEYEADRKARLGADADQPHRIKYRHLTR